MSKSIKTFTLSFFYIGVMVFIATILSLFYRWEQLDNIYRLQHIILIGITLHQIEEYRFPGGFPWAANTVFNSPNPDRFPLNKLMSWFINITALALSLVFVLWILSPVAAAAFGIFALAELGWHTIFGIIMLKKYRSQGKETIYFPGNATTWFILTPAGLAMLYELVSRNLLDPMGWVIAIVSLLILGGVFYIYMKIFANPDSPYNFDETLLEGYFRKFLN